AVPMGESAAGFIVQAESGGEPLIAYVARGSTGLRIAARDALDGSVLSTLTFDGVAVAPESIIARGSGAAALRDRLAFILKIGLAAELFGLTQAALATTLDYL